jgi:hypothetical protein
VLRLSQSSLKGRAAFRVLPRVICQSIIAYTNMACCLQSGLQSVVTLHTGPFCVCADQSTTCSATMVDCANVVEIACTNICTLVTDRRIHTSRFKVQVCPTVPSDVRVEHCTCMHMHTHAWLGIKCSFIPCYLMLRLGSMLRLGAET